MPHSFQTQAIEVERFYTGVISQRNKLAIPIRISGRRIIELYDAILSGGDAEISVRNTLCRRAGYILFAPSTAIQGAPQKFYDFMPAGLPGTILPIVDTTQAVYYVPPGGATSTVIAIKQGPVALPNAQSSFFGLGNFLYIGNRYFNQKWDGGTTGQGSTNWGIPAAQAVQGNFATTSGVNGPTGKWANPNNVTNPTFPASAQVSPGGNSGGLIANGFPFTIPAGASVVAIKLTFQASFSGAVSASAGLTAQMMVNGSAAGTAKFVPSSTPIPSGSSVFLGGITDIWGLGVLTPTLVNQSTFGVQFSGAVPTQNSGPVTFNVWGVTLQVYYCNPLTATPTGSGSFAATQGFQYVGVYGNSNDGNISNPFPISTSTGAFSSKANVTVGLTASPDAQVNQIRVFRTTDTGTGTVLLELPNSPFPNATANVTDSAADNQLVPSSALSAPSLAFSPPPGGARLMAWYAGRLWAAVGNVLYYSAGPDNAPLGNGASNWPPQNIFPLPSEIVKLVPLTGGNGMLVWTLDKIHIVQGITNPGFTINVWAEDIGAKWENAVDSDGSTIYAFTSDRIALQITSTGLIELSDSVSDVTDNWDPTQVYVCQHRAGSQDKRVFFSDGSTQMYPFNIGNQCWEPLHTPVDGQGLGAIGSIEITPGVKKLLKGQAFVNPATGLAYPTGPILQRDLNTFTDNGVQYTWGSIFGNIPITDPTQLANVDSIVLRMTNAGSLPKVYVLANEITPTVESPFIELPEYVDEPPEADKPPQSYRAKKFYTSQGANLWTQMTHLQIQFAFAKSSQMEEVLSWGLFPNQSADENQQASPQVQGR